MTPIKSVLLSLFTTGLLTLGASAHDWDRDGDDWRHERGHFEDARRFAHDRDDQECRPAPVYKICTDLVSRENICKTTYDSCGRACVYRVSIATYRARFSDGTSKTYQVTTRV